MTDMNDDIKAWLEKRDSERVAAKLDISFKLIGREEAEAQMEGGGFGDVFSAEDLKSESPSDDPHDAFTENISISGLKLTGDMRLVGGKPLKEGDYLFVELKVPEAPMPVRTLATVIWCEADKSKPPLFHAGLFFVAINRQDVAKVARFLVLQRRAKQ
jgi:hypothetical protein